MEKTYTRMMEMSNDAYDEFFELLEANEIEPKVVRIALAGFGCSGPRFGLMQDDIEPTDLIEKVNDITFVVAKDLFDDYEGFMVLSDEENFGGGMSLRPRKIDENSGCATCASGC